MHFQGITFWGELQNNYTYALEQIIISYMPLQVSMTYYPYKLLDSQFFMLPYISQVNIP